ncbi:MAG: hypothetical protein RQ875_13725 [Vicingaceae bacterium]|nr:hypothetical protein [Vicingaceae bacterium]
MPNSETEFSSNDYNLRTQKFNIVHNGNTLNLNENAVMPNLQHGDLLGSVEDNVRFQGIVIDQQNISINNPLFVSYRSTAEFATFNNSLFGDLDFNSALQVTYLNGPTAIVIPIIKDGDSTFLPSNRSYLTAYIVSNSLFTSYVIHEELIGNGSTQIADLSVHNISGNFTFFKPDGKKEVQFFINNNLIEDIVIDLDDGAEATCFQSCYARVRRECDGHFACSVICATPIAGDIIWTAGVASCCGLDCALTGQSGNC